MKKINPLTVCLNNEKGMVLVVALLVAAVLIILGTTAFMTTTTDIKISSVNKQSDRAFYAAEAGLEEARGRMRANFTPNTNRIDDSNPTQTGWMYFIGTDTKSQTLGYNSGNTLHTRTSSLQTALDYTVAIKHQTDSSGNILYWGDPDGDGSCERNTSTGRNIYLVRSYGVFSGAKRAVEEEISRVPPITAPGALYVEATTTIQGTSTNVIGLDQCGGANVPGVVTTLAASTVSKTGNPVVSGSTSSTWSVEGGATNMDVQSVVDSWKQSADYVYNKVSTTDTGMNWGTPTPGATLQNPSSCSVSNVVYYNTYNGTNNTYIKLTGGSTGCGVLVVDGDLELHGNFNWYGVILVSGSITYSGGGNKNVTGAVIAGGSVDADLVGGNANIVYCSTAISNQTIYQPLRRLSWKLMGQ